MSYTAFPDSLQGTVSNMIGKKFEFTDKIDFKKQLKKINVTVL
jgi:hypothetical protein